jgi:hypothetical protein
VLPFHQKYISYRVDGDNQRLPLLHIRLIGQAGQFTTIALVDSGATTTFIPPELAAAAGLVKISTTAEGLPAVGAGGTFPNDEFAYDVELVKGGSTLMRIRGTALVPREMGRIPYVVLGRDNLFKIYDITFRDQKQLLVMRPATHSSY